MPDDTPATDLDPTTVCLGCAERLIQLDLEVLDRARLVLSEDVHFLDRFGRAATIWRTTDELWLAGWWSHAQPRHAMLHNASRGRGTRYSRLCASRLDGKLKRAK